MQPKSVLKRHAGLVDKMANRVGVDLEEKILRGELETDELSNMVLRCTSCTNPEECSELLESRAEGNSTPPYCRNAELLNQLNDT